MALPRFGEADTSFRAHLTIRAADSPGMATPIYYETRARYASDEPWITVDVSVSHRVAMNEALFLRDPWGRDPVELHILRITGLPDAA
jgi:hypothetical protein